MPCARWSPLVTAAVLVAVGTGCAAGTRTAAPSLSGPPSPSAVPSASPTPSASPAPRVSHLPTAVPTIRATATSPYRWSARTVTARDLPHSWHPGCPVGPSQLRLLSLSYVGFDGTPRTGELVVAARAVPAVVEVFRALFDARFPIRSLRSVDAFGGSDDASMAADNTSAFNCRQAVGGSGWSQHAYGLAVDVDPRENPYLYGGQVLPPQGAAYTRRSPYRPGMAVTGGVLVRAFTAQGWGWGGRWKDPDYQHFSSNGQ